MANGRPVLALHQLFHPFAGDGASVPLGGCLATLFCVFGFLAHEAVIAFPDLHGHGHRSLFAQYFGVSQNIQFKPPCKLCYVYWLDSATDFGLAFWVQFGKRMMVAPPLRESSGPDIVIRD